MAVAQPKLDALEARLAGMSRPEGGAWISAAREAALTRLSAMGLPAPRDEYWRFTKPASLVSPEPVPAAVFDMSDEVPIYDGIERLKLVFTDGVFDAAASDPLELAGIEIERLADAADADLHWARDLYGTLEARGQEPVTRPLAALNTAFAADGVLIRVTG
ncbi:MAG: Fe-S cluster assembly protein SufD, partial [Maritimibacter sp.]